MKLKLTVLCCAMALSMTAFGAEAKKKATTARPAAPAKAAPADSAPMPMSSGHDSMSHGSSGATYGMAGCGLGSMIFGNKPGIIQIFATTTNGTFGNQTFGITTGTLNCKPDSTAMSAELFITVNKEAFAKDVSRGSGESIENLSQIVGCKDSNMFGNKLQNNYNNLFNQTQFESAKATSEIMNMIHNDSELAKNCKNSG